MTTTAPMTPTTRHFASRSPASFGFREVLYDKADGIARITINRPHNFNAYSTAALEELATAFRDATFDDAVGVIVLTGAGDRAFCTGGDVKEYAEAYVGTPRDYWKYMALFRAYIESILNTGKPVIARINGIAVGGGNESQLACDLAVMAQHAYLKQVGTQVGSVACGGATQWLPITVGDRRAREMLLLNEPDPGRAGARVGAREPGRAVGAQGRRLDRVGESPSRSPRPRRGGTATASISRGSTPRWTSSPRRLLETFPECTRYTKQQTNFWKDLAWHQTVRHAQDWLSLHYACWEPVEGMRAFTEKRPARYALLRERAAQGGSSEAPWGAPVRDCRGVRRHESPRLPHPLRPVRRTGSRNGRGPRHRPGRRRRPRRGGVGAPRSIATSRTGPGAAAATFSADVRDAAAVGDAVARITRERGGLDWVVCAAGIIRDRVSWKMSDAEWDDVLDVNLTGAFKSRASRRAAPAEVRLPAAWSSSPPSTDCGAASARRTTRPPRRASWAWPARWRRSSRATGSR